MKKWPVVLIVSMGSPLVLAEGFLVEIKVLNVTEARGQMMVAMHDRAETYMSRDKQAKPYFAAEAPVSSTGELTVNVPSVAAGDYAIAIYHDVNGNGELDSGLFGIPKEPYGFSNNLSKLTPPSFEQARFTISQPVTVTIQLK